MIWYDIRFKFFLGAAVAFLLFLAMIPVALTGGFFATKYIYCDVAKLCPLIKK
jgi:hypothetical protein